MWRQFLALLRKDVLRELRTRETLVGMALFALLAMVVFHFAFDAGVADLTPFVGGMLWVTFIFAALLGLNRSFAQEKDEHCLDGLLLCPVDRVVVFLAKSTANLLFLLAVQVVTVPVFVLFFVEHGAWHRLPVFVLLVLLGDVGICALGTLLATVSMNTRARDLLLPVLFLPLIVPVVIAAAGATATVAAGGGLEGMAVRLAFLAGFDAVVLVVAYGTYEFALGE